MFNAKNSYFIAILWAILPFGAEAGTCGVTTICEPSCNYNSTRSEWEQICRGVDDSNGSVQWTRPIPCTIPPPYTCRPCISSPGQYPGAYYAYYDEHANYIKIGYSTFCYPSQKGCNETTILQVCKEVRARDQNCRK